MRADDDLRAALEQARRDYAEVLMAMPVHVMTVDEERDLASIARAVRRIEANQTTLSGRLDAIETFIDQVRGMVQLTRWVLSLLGIGGVSLILWALTQQVSR